MFGRVVIDYYGAPTPLTQMATINIPEARMAVIKPYDAGQLQAIEKAIRDSDLGVNPGTDGIVIRVVFPQLTEQRRRELGKTARSKGEDAKVSIRNIRRKAKDTLDKMSKDGDVGEDDVARAEKELQSAHRPVRRAGRRAGQAQGSRAARGLMARRPATGDIRVEGRPEPADGDRASGSASARWPSPAC